MQEQETKQNGKQIEMLKGKSVEKSMTLN